MSCDQFEPSAPHFIQIIDQNTLRNGHLMILPDFVNVYWEEITNPIFLLLPNGANWELNWEKRNAHVWLTNNSKEFAEFYSLRKGHLLLFRYEGNSHFRVIIFDRSASEIDYPSSKHKTKINATEAPKCVETEIPHPRTTKVDNAKKPRKRGGRRTMNTKTCCSISEAMGSEKSLQDSEVNSALKSAQAFPTENPSFICQMCPSYILRYEMTLPANCITLVQQKVDKFVTLEVPNGGTWDMKVKLNPCTGQIRLTTGWKDFVQVNNLKIGDVCLFEQFNSAGDTLFRVNIFRAKQESNSPQFQAYEDGANHRKQKGVENDFAQRSLGGIAKKSRRTIDDSEFGRHNSKVSEDQFTLFIKPNQVNAKRHIIPFEFMRKYLRKGLKEGTLRVGERTWPVKVECYCYPSHRFGRFSTGWSAFVKECNLKEGDTCLFHLIDAEKFVFDVTVSSRID